MNWTLHPYLYQITHWWHWLTYSQNASALQAVAAVVATAAAIAAGFFAGMAYLATVRQVDLAREQLQLAHAQFNAEREHLEEERKSNRKTAEANYQRTVAEEEAVRPRFRLVGGYMPTGGVQALEFTNAGNGPANDVCFTSLISGATLLQTDYVGPGNRFIVRIDPVELTASGVQIRFRTTFGSLWKTILTVGSTDAGERVMDVTRLYALTDGGG